MQKSLLLFVGMLVSILFYGQIPAPNLVKSYLFTAGSLQNTLNPGSKDLVKTGTASTLVPSNYLVADDAISLNGDYMSGGTSAGNTDFSLSFWIKTSTNDASNRFIFSQFNPIPGFGVKCTLLNGRVVFGGAFKQSANASSFNSVTSLNSLADGRWHHVVATAAKITESVVVGHPAPNYFRYALYVDDVLQGVVQNPASIYIISLLDNATPFMIGTDNALIGARYESAIDDIRFYERALSVAEIHNLYFDNIPEGIVYVDKSATGANDGTTWANAFTELQTALSSYVSKKTIWVAAGRYTPHPYNRNSTFMLPNALKLYGGFNGTETDINQRDPKVNTTTLSGDLAGNDNGNIVVTEATRQDNSLHVVTLRGNVKNIVVDGFTISDGNASGSNNLLCATAAASQYNDQRGAAVYAFPYVSGQSITALFRNCILERNSAYSVAVSSATLPCGVTGLSTDLDFESCIVRNNRSRDLSAFLFSGNSSYQLYSKGSIVNSLFHDNISDNGSSSVHLVASISNGGTALGIDVQVVNCTFADNSGLSGNVFTMQYAANTVIRNSIIYGNGSGTPFAITTTGSTVQNTIAQGGQLGSLNADPLFKNVASNDFALSCGSPAINTGNDANIVLAKDLAGGNRKQGTVDMGAYEFVSFSSITAISKNITVQLDATGNALVTPSQIDNGSGTTCGVAFTLSVNQSAFTCADIGDNIVTLTATEDSGGAFSTTPATVTVVDSSDPIVVTQNLTIQLDANGSASITASDVNNGSSDNCTSGVDLVLALDKTNFTSDDLGTNEIVLTVTDANGNHSSASVTVTVEDNIVPTAIAQNVEVELDATGNAILSAVQINDGSTDNSTTSENLLMTISKTSFTCSDLGENIITFTVADASGNQSSTPAVVTVIDNLAPTIITKDIEIVLDINGNALITTALINNGSSDNCSEADQLIFNLDKTAFTTADLGMNTVSLTVEDANGNSSNSSATVIVSEKIHQTIDFEPLPNVTYGTSNLTLVGAANSSLPITYSIVSGPATLSENTLTITGVGTVTIVANQDGDGEYYPAPAVQQSFDVDPAVLIVTAEDKTITYGEAIPVFTFHYTGFVNEESMTVLISEPSITTDATTNSDAGLYTITLSGGVADNYTFQFVPGTLTINKADQIISMQEIATKAVNDGPFDIVANTTSGLPLSYEISGPASLSGATITLNGTPGQVSVTGTQAGNINFNDATATVTFDVKELQTITFTSIDDQILEDGEITLTASSTSGLGITFEIISGPATLSGNVVSFDDIGMVVVKASQPGNGNFLPAPPVEQSFEIITITGIENNSSSVHIYPNPATDVLHIEVENSNQSIIGVFSLQGTEMLGINKLGPINIAGLSKGLYLIKINSSGKISTYKFFKN